MEKYIIGIDAGTSKIKSVLFDKHGAELFVSSEKVELITPRPGWVEQDMNGVWQSVMRTVKDLMERAMLPAEAVLAVAITGQADGVWLVDDKGEPVCNAINWTDSRALDKCIQWMSDGTDRKIFEIIGSTFYPGSQIVLTSWLLENEPELLHRARWNCTCKDWIKFKFTGTMSCDESFNIFGNTRERRWDDRLMDIYGFAEVQDQFPPVRTILENHDPLLPEIAQQLGLNAGIPVFGGPFDFVANAIGTGTLNDGDACAVIGTTTNLSFAQNQCSYAPENVGYTLCSAGSDKWIRAFGVMAGTPNLEWTIGNLGMKYILAAQQKGIDVFDEVESCVEQIPLGSGGLIYHPYMLPGGERSPFVKPTARAQFFGLGVEHTVDHMMRAVYEGIAYSVQDCFRCREKAPTTLRVAGGGSKSKFGCQMLADVTGVDVVTVQGHEFGARGTAMVAAYALGLYDSMEQAVEQCVHERHRYVPDPEKTRKYAEYFRLYQDIYRQVWDLWDARAALMQG